MIAAGIVLFNPDLLRLEKNINAIVNQVDSLIIIDNSPSPQENIKRQLNNYKNIKVIYNDSNLGVAKALNQMCSLALDDGHDWILTLDQDSICPNNIIEEYKTRMSKTEVGILCPVINDMNNPNGYIDFHEDIFVDKCITSGSLVNLDIWKKISGFDEWMFIDFVDFDYSKRLIMNNFKILKVHNVILTHEIGSIRIYKFFSKKIHVMNHSAFRKYYMARNNIYLAKKYYPEKGYFKAFIRIVKLLIVVVIFEKQKNKESFQSY